MESGSWELSKENIQPLKKGRKMENLKPALQQQDDCLRTKLRQEKGAYEIAIETYEGDDPLEPWCAYIEWTEQNFPKGGKECNFMELLQRCVAQFRGNERYRNDPRFVALFLSIADMFADPIEIYRYMSGKCIGNRVAEFYICWAIELELLGKMKGADEVYQNGLANSAEPRDELIQRHTQFSARMVHISVDKTKCTDATISEEHRAVLGPLKPRGRRHLVGTNRIGAAKLDDQPIQNDSSAHHAMVAPVSHRPRRQTPITVFTDENCAEASSVPARAPNLQTVLPSSSETVKENERQPTKWKEAAIVVKTPVTTSSVKFEVHVDEDIAPAKPAISHKSLDTTNALGAKKVKAPDVLKAICGVGEPEQKADVMRERYQCCITKVHSKQGEVQFEEMRAARWRREIKVDAKLTDQETCLHKIKENLMEAMKALSVFNSKGLGTLAIESSVPASEETLLTKKSGVTQLDRLLVELLPLSMAVRRANELLATRSDFSTGSGNVTSAPMESKSPIADPGRLSSGDPGSYPYSRSSTGSGKPGSQNSTVATTPGNTTKFIRGLFADSVVQLAPVEQSDGETNGCGRSVPDAAQVARPTMSPPPPLPLPEKPKLAFTVFQDTFTCAGGTSAASAVMQTQLPFVPPPTELEQELEQENIENLQNIPPKDYKQPENKRVLAGILKPSIGIEFEPLEMENEAEENDEDMLDAISPALDFVAREDLTMVFPTSTCFLKNLRVASTPTNVRSMAVTVAATSQQHADCEPEQDRQQLVIQTKEDQWQEFGSKDNLAGQDHFTPRRYTRPTSFGYTAKHYNLSAISECSREYRSSSSSGTSSSAAASQGKSQLCASSRIKTEEEFNKSDKSRVVATLTFPEKSVNPFDDNMIAAALDSLKVPLCSIPGYVRVKGSLPRVKVDANMFFGDDMYHVLELCAEGGYAKVFKAYSLNDNYLDKLGSNDNEIFVLKVQTPACPSEFYISKELQTRIKKLDFKYSAVPSIMNVATIYIYDNASVQVSSYLPHGTLLDVCNLYTSCNQLMSECLALHFTIEMLHIIEQIHACHIIHADIKPDNFMLMQPPSLTVERNSYDVKSGTTKTLKLIDYGLSIDMDLLPAETTFTVSTKTDQFQCHEMKDNRPWTYQTDFYGIAACAHVMLFGSYMKTTKVGDTWKINGACKRYWSYDWKQFFHDLLNIPDCNHQPNTRTIRESLEENFALKRIQKDFPDKVRELQSMMQCKSQLH